MAAKVRVKDGATRQFTKIRDALKPEDHRNFAEKDLESSFFSIEKGGEDALEVTEIHYVPGAVIDPHSHSEDELIYVLEGSLCVNNRALGKGSSLFIAKETVYAFHAGDNGLKMLTFRPRADDRAKAAEVTARMMVKDEQ